MSKVCFITAIYGNYEATCKKYIAQAIETDFICFTDNKNIEANGWIIDTTPYHLVNRSPLDVVGNSMRNSIDNNKHTFNVAKYYKQAFQNIPRLRDYDAVVCVDGTIQIWNPYASLYILNNISKHKIIGWAHEHSKGKLLNEVNASNFFRYTSTNWNGQDQPYQDIFTQYNEYIKSGYTDDYFRNINNSKPNFGIWLTCFVAFANKDTDVSRFLDNWYMQTLIHTTQDQIGFPYVCQSMNLIPYTLPDHEINGDRPHDSTDFYIRLRHGI
jgi:hypothetical protein